MEQYIKKIGKISYVTEVHQQIKDLIVNGTWREGTKLPPEKELSARFNVSRVVIREALQKLRTENLIVTRQGCGSFVSNPSNYLLLKRELDFSADHLLTEADFQDLMDIRSCIEFRSIERAVEYANSNDFSAIKQALKNMYRYVHDLTLFTEADWSFHYSIVLASHNKIFIYLMNSCKDFIFTTLREMNRLNSNRQWVLDIHRQVYLYILDGKAQEAINCPKENNEYNYVKFKPIFK